MIDPKSAPRGNDFDSSINPVSARRNAHPWAWLVGLTVALLLIWGFFGMNHLKVDAEFSTSPQTATSIAD
ncbi:MAG: hypothetical protein ABIQ36_12220 [Rhodanobacter sp.]